MITVCKADASHLHEISEIERECFSSPWSASDLASALTNPAFICLSALSGEKPVGYVMMYNAADEGEIANLAVTKEMRRQGIGEMLMEHATAMAKDNGVVTMYLEVRSSNIGAKSLYEKLGFSPIGIRKNYYREPREDAVVMAKVLK